MANGDLYEARWEGQVNGNPWGFTLRFVEAQGSADPNIPGTAALSNAIAANQPETLRNTAGQDWSLEEINVRKIFGSGSPPLGQYIDNGVGLGPFESLPLNKALVVRLKQEDFDAKFNGRCFLSILTEDQTDINRVTNPGVIQAVQTYFEKFLALTVTYSNIEYLFEMCVIEADRGRIPPRHAVIRSIQVPDIIYNQRIRTTREPGFVSTTEPAGQRFVSREEAASRPFRWVKFADAVDR